MHLTFRKAKVCIMRSMALLIFFRNFLSFLFVSPFLLLYLQLFWLFTYNEPFDISWRVLITDKFDV